MVLPVLLFSISTTLLPHNGISLLMIQRTGKMFLESFVSYGELTLQYEY